jgi:hypothetical protein
MQFFDWHYSSRRQNSYVRKERSVDAIHFRPVRNIAYIDRALHDVCDRSFRCFDNDANVFEGLCCFLGERALYEIAGTVKRQLPRDEEKIAHAHRLRVVAARLRCGRCFDGFMHRNWRTEANPEHSDKWLVVSEANHRSYTGMPAKQKKFAMVEQRFVSRKNEPVHGGMDRPRSVAGCPTVGGVAFCDVPFLRYAREVGEIRHSFIIFAEA